MRQMKLISKKKASKRRTYRLRLLGKHWMSITETGIVGRKKLSLKAGNHLDEEKRMYEISKG